MEPRSPLASVRVDADANWRSLRRSALINGSVTATLLLIGSRLLTDHWGTSNWLPLKALLLFVLALGWLVRDLDGHLPHPRLLPANQVTLARLALVALLGGTIGEPALAGSWLLPGLAGLVLLLDGLDGWLARRGGWASAFGARFDMETDAGLILVLAILAWTQDRAGAWVLLSGLLRYFFLGLLWLRPALDQPLPPSRWRKAVCVIQVMVLLVCLAPPLTPTWSQGLAAAGLAVLCLSFARDLIWLWRQTRQSGSAAPARRPRPWQGQARRHHPSDAATETAADPDPGSAPISPSP